MFVDHLTAYRKAYLVGILDRLCAELDITEARKRQAQERYEGVARWLAAGDHALLRSLEIYLQGSTALGTSVRPIGRLEHDVDLVAFMPSGSEVFLPAYVKKVIGDRLREHAAYAKLLEEKLRCWRLAYANEFHLDITPSILNLACRSGGELVPDKALKEWKETNPKGYRAAFDRRAKLLPILRIAKAFDEAVGARANIEPFPAANHGGSLLCRIVQVAKRHRDVHFEGSDAALSPISVILTTLIAWSYEACVTQRQYDTEYDVILDVLRRMPEFIGRVLPDGTRGWYIPNETTHGENFAERWNDDPRRARAFFAWHAKVLADLEKLANVEGVDQVRSRMNDTFGEGVVGRAFGALDEEIATARRSGLLRAAPVIGITAAPSVAAAVPVRQNTFFGRDVW
jgi:hypothetical protein